MFRLDRSLYFSGVVSLAGNMLLVFPLVARFTEPAEFGHYCVALAAVSLLAPAAAMGIHVYVLRTAGNADLALQAIGSCVAQRVGSHLLSVSLALGLAGLIWNPAWYAFATFATAASLVAVNLTRAVGRPLQFSLLTVGTQTAAVAIGGLVLGLGADPREATGVLGTAVGLLTWIYWRMNRPAGHAITVSKLDWRTAMRFSIALIPHLVGLLALTQGVRLAVSATQGFADAAAFQFAAILGGVGVTIGIILHGVTSVEMMNVSAEEYEKAFARYACTLAIVAGSASAATAVAACWLIQYWVPASYDAQEIGFAALAFLPAAPLQALGDVQLTAALRLYKSGAVSAATASGAFLGLLATVLLSPSLQLMAGGVGVSIGLAARAAMMAMLLKNEKVPSFHPSLHLSLAFSVVVAGAGCLTLAA